MMMVAAIVQYMVDGNYIYIVFCIKSEDDTGDELFCELADQQKFVNPYLQSWSL